MIEKRFQTTELRAKGRRLEGYAALFGIEARIGGGVVETITPGAFSRTLEERGDILALVDHDPHRVLARTRSGTLRLSQDTRGLAFDLDVPSTQAGHDVLALAERNDLGGMSFGFAVLDEHLDGSQRELRAVDLFEISVVSAFPAYEGTVINARAQAGSFLFRDAAARRLRHLELVK